MGELLELRNISKIYQHKNGETLAIKDVNLKIRKGEFISIIGPSGCRKINYIVNNSRIRKKDYRGNIHRTRKSRRYIL